MPVSTKIVKNAGSRKTEDFDSEKLMKSIKSACMSVHAPDGEATKIAEMVSHEVLNWTSDKPEVTTADVRHQASKHLEHYNPDAAYLYKHHRSVM